MFGHAAGHLDVVARGNLRVLGAVGVPVGGHGAVKAPLLTQNAGEKVAVLGGTLAVDRVVGAHDRPGGGLLHADLEGLEVDFPQRPLGQAGVALPAVGLLVVAGEVLQGRGHAHALDAPDHGCSQLARQQRILGVILEVAAAQGAAVDVDGGGQPHAEAVLTHLLRARAAHLEHDLLIPGAGQQRRAGEGCGVHAAVPDNTQAGRAVRRHHVGHATAGQVAEAARVGHATPGLAAQQMHQLLVTEAVHKGVQGNAALVYIHQADTLDLLPGAGRGAIPLHRPLAVVGDGVVDDTLRRGAAAGYRRITAVRPQSAGQGGGGATAAELLQHPILIYRVDKGDRPGIPDVHPHMEAVLTLLQHIGRGADPALVVIAGELAGCEGDRHRLRLAGGQQPCLGKAHQHPGRLAQLALGRLAVDLHHLAAGHAARVGHRDGHADVLVLDADLRLAQGEGGVAQPEAEGIAHLLRRAGNGLKVAVAHEDVVLVGDVVLGFVEARGGGVRREIHREGVVQPPAGAYIAAQHVRSGHAALHARLPGQQRRMNAGIVMEPGGVHHAAGVQHHCHPGEGRRHTLHQRGLLPAEEVVAVEGLAGAVIALAGEAADGNHGRVRPGPGLHQQILGQGGLYGLPRMPVRSVLPGNIRPVVVAQRGEQANLALGFLFLQAIQDAADIGDRYVSAAAPALDVVRLSLAEHRDALSAAQGQQATLVLQQHHALTGRPAGQRPMLLAAGDPHLSAIQRAARHEPDPLPFAFAHRIVLPYAAQAASFFPIIASFAQKGNGKCRIRNKGWRRDAYLPPLDAWRRGWYNNGKHTDRRRFPYDERSHSGRGLHCGQHGPYPAGHEGEGTARGAVRSGVPQRRAGQGFRGEVGL